MATTILENGTSKVRIDHYLENFSYRPDVEFVDGELRERPIAGSTHGLLRSLLGAWFLNHRNEWNIKADTGIRTRVAAERVRLPDVIVDYKRKWPATLVDPPLIVIEVLSQTDSYSETKTLARDYIDMGVQNIWLVDPERRACEMYRDGAWLDAMRLDVPGSPIYVDMAEMFAILDADDAASPSAPLP